jgi:rubrerythrin
MATFTVTHDTGGTAKPVGLLYVPPERQVLDAGAGTALEETGLAAGFLADLLSACLAHERCGVHLYRSVANRTTREDLRVRYDELRAETERHVEILERLVADGGGDPQYVSPAARATEKAGAGLVETTFLLGGSIDPATQEAVMLEAVMLAEAKDHGNWELLATLTEEMADGPVKERFRAATAEVLAQEEEHYGWASVTRNELLFSMATGGRAMPAPPMSADLTGTGAPPVLDLTKDELYAQAQELDIEGRSKMTKDELRAAVAEAQGAAR